jgi:hypothetical protein
MYCAKTRCCSYEGGGTEVGLTLGKFGLKGETGTGAWISGACEAGVGDPRVVRGGGDGAAGGASTGAGGEGVLLETAARTLDVRLEGSL